MDDSTAPPPTDSDVTLVPRAAPRQNRTTRPTARLDPAVVATSAPDPAAAVARHPIPPALGARFDVLDVLGKGGMGVVYRARDRELGREVAIKLVLTDRPLHLEMFRAEARVLAGLEHTNVVRLYEYGVAGSAPYLVMELVRGRSLAARLAAGRPTLIEAVRIAGDVLAGLGAAHTQGIAHLDLKPGNVFLDEMGRGRVADFGLAQKADATTEGRKNVAGTPGYMAPEQWAGQPGLPSDMFAFGVLLHELLTGRKLLSGTLEEVRAAASHAATLPPPSRIQPSVPPVLDDLVRRALDPDPAARPTAAAAATSLVAWLESLPGRGARLAAGGELPSRPYKLLDHFTAADAAIFFGREDETAELMHLLDASAVRLAVVSGPCGIGKSSLLAAGVMRGLDPARHEPIALVSGPDPAGALRGAIAARAAALQLTGPAGQVVTPGELALDPAMVVDIAFAITNATRAGLVIQVDQLEELFTQNVAGAAQISSFFELVERLVEAQGLPLKIILSHRVEFRGELAPLEYRLARHTTHFELAEISRNGLVAAIDGPSRLEAYRFSYAPGLPERLADDILATTAGSKQSALPVCQIVCHQLWSRMREVGGSVIDAQLYRDALGGASGALQKWVESRLASPEYAATGGLAKRMLRELTVRDEGRERFSRALEESELLAFPDRYAARVVLERLIADQLVVREAAEDGTRRVRLASEVICPLVDQWMLEPDDTERAARILARAARQWDDEGRRRDDLLVGATLDLVARQAPVLTGLAPRETQFVKASLSARRTQRASAVARGTMVLAIVGTLVWMGFLRPGKLRLDSDPAGAEVFSGEERLGVTPLEWRTEPGQHTLTLRSDRHRDHTLTVRVPAGGETAQMAVLPPLFRTLSVNSDPTNALVEVRRKGAPASEGAAARGVTPFAAPLMNGAYTLSVARSGYLTRTLDDLVVTAGAAPLEQAVKLEANSGLLRVGCADKGSRMTLKDAGGRTVLEAALPMPSPVAVEAGRYRAECVGDGNVSDVFSVHVSRNTTAAYLAYTPAVEVLSERPQTPEEKAISNAAWVPDKSKSVPVDVDGDGISDLELSIEDKQVTAQRIGTARPLWSYPSGSMGTRVSAGDLDGLPGDEVVVSGEAFHVAMLDPLRGKARWVGSTFSEGLSRALLVDLDGDGVKDVVQGSSQVARMSPSGGVNAFNGRTGALLWSHPVPAGVAGFGPLADENGDGSLDIMVYCHDDKTRVISAPVRNTIWLAVHGRVLDRAQLADGGRALVLDPIEAQRYAISSTDGSPLTTTPPVPERLPGEPDYATQDRPRSIAMALEKNGAVQQVGLSGRTVKLTDAGGHAAWSYSEPGADWGELFVAAHHDFDGDGIEDLVVATFDLPNAAPAGRLTCLSGKTGQPLWGRDVPGRVGMPAVLADLNGDGKPELLVRSGDQAMGPDVVLALDGRTGRQLSRWLAGHSRIAPFVLTVGNVSGVLIDRGEPEARDQSAVELVRLRAVKAP